MISNYFTSLGRLNPDFFGELCFADHFRRPLTTKQYAAFPARLPAKALASIPSLDELNEIRSHFPNPERIVMRYIAPRGDQEAAILFDDSIRRLAFHFEGLVKSIFLTATKLAATKNTRMAGMLTEQVADSRWPKATIGWDLASGNVFAFPADDASRFIRDGRTTPPTPALGFSFHLERGGWDMLDDQHSKMENSGNGIPDYAEAETDAK